MLKHCQVIAVVGLGFSLGACGVSPLKARLDASTGAGGDAGAAAIDAPRTEISTPDAHANDVGADTSVADVSLEVPSDSSVSCTACTSWGTPVALGPSPAVLVELSGLAASRVHPGILYGHNDSGDSARFFALTQQAEVAAEIDLTGATATDWEDIQVGPCPSGSCVYIGDTGDNKLVRDQYVIHRLAEPATLPTDGSTLAVDTYESFPFVYPDGRHNAETLLVHPQTGQVFVIIKETGIPATVYEMPLPLKPDEEVTLTMVASLSVSPADGIVTDGAFHPCGDRLLIRTTSVTGLFELTRALGASLTSLFEATPVVVPVAVEPQGEGITYSIDGTSYFTSSETVSGQPVPSISVVHCASSP